MFRIAIHQSHIGMCAPWAECLDTAIESQVLEAEMDGD